MIKRMRKHILLAIGFFMLLSLAACSTNINGTTTLEDLTPSITIPSEDTTPTTDSKEDEYMNKTIELKIDNQVIDVLWSDNSSVDALKELAKDRLTINMS